MDSEVWERVSKKKNRYPLFVFGNKSEDVILCWLLFTAKPEGEWISRDGHLKQVFQSNVK